MPDLQFAPEVVTARTSWTASLWTLTGKHNVDYQHPILGRAPATRRPFRFGYSLYCRVEGGRIVETRDVSDRLELFQQMHILPVRGIGNRTITLQASMAIGVETTNGSATSRTTDWQRAR